MSVIRASEIGSFLYCNRAWWYRRQGVEPENQAELTFGIHLHRLHGRGVLAANIARSVAYILLLIGVALLILSAAIDIF